MLWSLLNRIGCSSTPESEKTHSPLHPTNSVTSYQYQTVTIHNTYRLHPEWSIPSTLKNPHPPTFYVTLFSCLISSSLTLFITLIPHAQYLQIWLYLSTGVSYLEAFRVTLSLPVMHSARLPLSWVLAQHIHSIPCASRSLFLLISLSVWVGSSLFVCSFFFLLL